jgi:putative transcriptional regulator
MGTNPREVSGVVGVIGPVVLVDLDADPTEVTPALRGIRIYAGRAGWDAEQLVDEIVEGSWFVVPGLPDDVIAGPKTDLWFSVLRRQPFPLALQAYHPGDLSRN